MYKYLFVLCVVLLLAGCGTDRPDLQLAVEKVSEDDGQYSVSATVRNNGSRLETNASMHGYDPTGTEVCSKGLGKVSETRTVHLSCERIPFVLLVGHEGKTNTYLVDRIHYYTGIQNGVHQYALLAENDPWSYPSDAFHGRPPGQIVYEAAKCEQWRRGGDFSALEQSPWLSWEKAPPETNRYYMVSLDNNTQNVLEENDSYWDDPESIYDSSIYPPTVLTPTVESAIRVIHGTDDDLSSAKMNESEYYRMLGKLTGTPLSSASELVDRSERINGRVSTHNDTTIDCWSSPPEYVGSRGVTTTVQIRFDGAIYRVSLAERLEYSGPATANASVNSSASG